MSSNTVTVRCKNCGLTVEPHCGTWAGRWSGFTHIACAGEHVKVEAAPAKDTAAPLAVDQGMLDKAVEKIAAMSSAWSKEYVLKELPDQVKKQLEALVPRELNIQIAKAPKVTVKRSHHCLPDVLTAVVAGAAPFLVGPAGSGKTTLAEQVAQAMGLKFYMAARVTSEYKLVGFVDANGKTIRTQFREAFEHGGLFLFDEVDASDPDALTAFNAALANGLGDFPDGMVRKHKDFHAIAAGNTFGRGADRQYVGRNQLDAATLDRFQTFEVDYDEQLEVTLAGNEPWTRYVQAVRKAVEQEKVRHVVSPRASIAGAKLLAAGMAHAKVADACIWKGLPEDARNRVTNRMSLNGYREAA